MSVLAYRLRTGRRLFLFFWSLMLCTVGAGCSHAPSYPITQHSQPFEAMNARATGTAPDVAQRLGGERLVRARSEPQNWLTYYGAYDGQRYSELDQINTQNVKTLKPAWVFQAGVIGLIANPATYALEAAPIVVDGVMYLSGWDGYVWALDAATGQEYWRYRQAIPLDTPMCCGNVNRGVAVANGKVFFASPNGYLIALDATSGKRIWEQAFVDPRAGESATSAPLVIKSLVIVGSSGAEYGVRGHIDAFDIDTGARRWRHYNVPKPGEPGAESWRGDGWARGGGTAWVTGTYDPDLDLLYWGTGNAGPDFDGGARPGNNLYTDSVVALHPSDGDLQWYYQWTPHDVWDYDGVNENILFERDGRKLLGHFDKNGFLFILDRTNGQLVLARPFARATWGTIESGHVTAKLQPTKAGVEICPGPAGAKEWVHASFNPRTGFLYAPVIEQCATFTTRGDEFREGMAYWGGGGQAKKGEQWGVIKAFDPSDGREVWAWRDAHPIVSSTLSTAGGLLFAGRSTGEFIALNASTGELMWEFQTGSGIHSNPVTYSVNGRQFVAVASGWGGWMKGFSPELYGGTRGSALVVFALP
jgi:alcohol dehydrogenase (cytochrome c)